MGLLGLLSDPSLTARLNRNDREKQISFSDIVLELEQIMELHLAKSNSQNDSFVADPFVQLAHRRWKPSLHSRGNPQ